MSTKKYSYDRIIIHENARIRMAITKKSQKAFFIIINTSFYFHREKYELSFACYPDDLFKDCSLSYMTRKIQILRKAFEEGHDSACYFSHVNVLEIRYTNDHIEFDKNSVKQSFYNRKVKAYKFINEFVDTLNNAINVVSLQEIRYLYTNINGL